MDFDRLDPDDLARAEAAIITEAEHYFDARRARVSDFVRRNFGVLGALRLHRAALGLDILRAPLNVILSPVFILSRLIAWAASGMGLPGIAFWLRSRRILLPTAVAAEVERLLIADLLELPWQSGRHGSNRDALAEALLRAPEVRALIADETGEAGLARLQATVSRTLGDYTGTRSAVAEMTTAFSTLGAGAVAFQALTPGVLSMAPGVAAILAHQAAIAAFPLGGAAGAIWYGVFPADPPVWMTAGVVAGLVFCGAIFTAFAGIIADPIQTALGIHRRRLNRLIDALEDEFTGTGTRGFTAREHYLARLMDVADASMGALRTLRG